MLHVHCLSCMYLNCQLMKCVSDKIVYLVIFVIFDYNQLVAQFFFMYVYLYSLHVSDSYVSIIRGINCITISGMSLCVDDGLVFRSICSCIPDRHLHRVTYTRCSDTINSPDECR